MKNFLEKYLWKVLRKADTSYHLAKTSWAQQGEDLLIDFIFKSYLNCGNPSYLDIGANHPFALSNTYLFYKKGCRGVNIEPDPALIEEFKRLRPRDININVGVGKEGAMLDFYVMSTPTLNTFSKEVAEKNKRSRHFGYPCIVEVKKIKVVPVNELLKKHFSHNHPYFISIDVEGWDYEILASIDFTLYKPDVICIETNKAIEENIDEHGRLLAKAGYLQYAETSINSIFVKAGIIDNIRRDVR